MKPFEELTHEELISLTSEELQNYIKFDIVSQGIEILDKPKEPAYRTVPEPTEAFFMVDGFDSIKLFNKHVAEQLAIYLTENSNLIIRNLDYDYKDCQRLYHFTNRTQSGNKTFNVTTEMAYTKEGYNEASAVAKENEKLRKEFEDSMRAYNAYSDVYDIAYGKINGVYWAAIKKEDRKKYLRDKYFEMLAIADNNAEIADRFFVKTYNAEGEKLLPEIKEQMASFEEEYINKQ